MIDFVHPEKQTTEVFLTNSDESHFGKIKFKSKRKGKVAYDGKGNKLNITDWFPVFIEEEELNAVEVDLKIVRKEFAKSF